MLKNDILETIGETPLVRINRLNPNNNILITAKLEGTNPGGSIKDRIAFNMLTEAETDGLLTPDKIIIEPTSGNTGIGLAMVAAVKGYRLICTMSEWMSTERRRTLEAFGAEIVLTPGEKGTDGAIEKAHEMYRQNPEKYFMPNQYSNQNNPIAHYNTTAMEIWRQTGGQVTHFIAGMGTSGTLMGVSRRLKELNPEIKIIGVEPNLNHKIQGLKNMKEAVVPEIFDLSRLDNKVNVTDENAFAMTRLLAREEGIFTGISAGAAIFTAVETAKTLDKGYIVVIIPDRGDKYLSTEDLFCCERCENRSDTCPHSREN